MDVQKVEHFELFTRKSECSTADLNEVANPVPGKSIWAAMFSSTFGMLTGEVVKICQNVYVRLYQRGFQSTLRQCMFDIDRWRRYTDESFT